MIKFRDAVRVAGYEQMSVNITRFNYDIDYANRIIHVWRRDRERDVCQVFFENVLYIELGDAPTKEKDAEQ